MLTDTQRAILDLEQSWWAYPGAKVSAIRERTGMSEPRYYQALSALIDDPAALEASPLVVKRLRRLRDARRAQRTVGGVTTRG